MLGREARRGDTRIDAMHKEPCGRYAGSEGVSKVSERMEAGGETKQRRQRKRLGIEYKALTSSLAEYRYVNTARDDRSGAVPQPSEY